jgi:hypothetical protein
MAMPPESEPDAWIVSIRVSAAPGDNTSKELGHYKVLKRTANVVETVMGETVLESLNADGAYH